MCAPDLHTQIVKSWNQIPLFDAMAREIALEHGTGFIDASAISSMRADSAIKHAAYKADERYNDTLWACAESSDAVRNASFAKEPNPDCTHHCLPGMPDTISDLIYTALKHKHPPPRAFRHHNDETGQEGSTASRAESMVAEPPGTWTGLHSTRQAWLQMPPPLPIDTYTAVPQMPSVCIALNHAAWGFKHLTRRSSNHVIEHRAKGGDKVHVENV